MYRTRDVFILRLNLEEDDFRTIMSYVTSGVEFPLDEVVYHRCDTGVAMGYGITIGTCMGKHVCWITLGSKIPIC